MAAPYLPSREPLFDIKNGRSSGLMTLWMQAIQVLLFGGDPKGCFIRWGTGSPEGVVYGPVGSVFLRTDGGVGSTMYVKQVGNSNVNTGWAAK